MDVSEYDVDVDAMWWDCCEISTQHLSLSLSLFLYYYSLFISYRINCCIVCHSTYSLSSSSSSSSAAAAGDGGTKESNIESTTSPR
mmetsp:Transcript_27397/g.29584  ORF Transcript_27397/g.29584 Transcript_27397/m.29584 type:complete len:86 (-) Transcript_27397:1099-1356(-)